MALKYRIETFGCQMNVHDSERLAGLLEGAGYEAATDAADLVVLNTCSVRERAEEKLYGRLHEIRNEPGGEDRLVAVTGCVAQQEGPKLFDRLPRIDAVAGTQSLRHLPALIEEARSSRRPAIDIHPHDDVSFPLGVVRHADAVRARVTIIEGCNEFCSFCVVPYTRGHERMRPVSEILWEVREAVATGHCEIQLLGQIVNHYAAPDDAACDFAALLERVNAVEGVTRIRFASPHPRHVTRRLIAAIRDLPGVCKHLHLPVQSGSDAVLKAMRRRYTRAGYLELVDQLRDQVPGLAISTDVIIGFPGERPEDFELTMDLLRRVRFQSMYSFKYSPRPNTLAIQRLPDDVAESDKTARIVALQQLQRTIQLETHGAAVGTTVDVLVDSRSRRRDWELAGRTTGNFVVNFPGDPAWFGTVVPVEIVEGGPNSLRGVPATRTTDGGRAC